MKDNSARYSLGKGLASFLLCGLLGCVWGATSVPIVAAGVALLVYPLALVLRISWWTVNLPIALVLGASLWMVHKVVARSPVDADEIGKSQCAKDAIYGTVGFALFYLLAWLGLVLLYINMVPL